MTAAAVVAASGTRTGPVPINAVGDTGRKDAPRRAGTGYLEAVRSAEHVVEAFSDVAAVTALLAVLGTSGCASFGRPDATNTVVPAGSEWVAPAAGLRSRDYHVAEVDTIIGFVRGVRTWSDGAGTLEDELTVEIYRDATTNRRVKRVTVQTHRVRRGGVSPYQEDLGAVVPSPNARRDAEDLLIELGCPSTETDQRMTLEGPVFQAWCSEAPDTAPAGAGAP